VLELRIHEDDAGQRLDRLLRKLLPGATLAHVFKLLRQGRVRLDGARAEGATRVAAGQVLRVAVSDAVLQELRGVPRRKAARAGEVVVVHRDAHLLVADKPAGLALHGGSGVAGDTLEARVRALVGARGAAVFQPAPAHRLDRGTSGLVVFGLSGAGLRGFTALLRAREVRKTYLALVRGVPRPSAGVIDLPVAGQRAVTRYAVRSRRGGEALLELMLDTGRRHQIRAHLAAIGHPVLGDRRYGGDDAQRLMLHAWRLSFAHPVDGHALDLEAPPPPEFAVG
jgi:23S rRNA pseudouridine955/2504/2580 synthase